MKQIIPCSRFFSGFVKGDYVMGKQRRAFVIQKLFCFTHRLHRLFSPQIMNVKKKSLDSNMLQIGHAYFRLFGNIS